MKILMLSKALVTGVYQKKLEELARLPGVELMAVVPPYWHEERVGVLRLERRYTEGYRLVELPMVFNGRHHIHFYPRLGRIVRDFRPDIFHVDEEPYNTVTFHATLLGRSVGARVVFFTWQNLYRRYPPPFRLFELANYRLAAAAVAGINDAAEVLRRKGYRGRLEVIPQFGVDPDLFQPRPDPRPRDLPQIGYAGRLVPEKGVDVLIEAFARLHNRAQLHIIGSGTERTRLEMQAGALGVRDRVLFRGAVPAADMPQVLAELDVLVIPSRTRRNWKEQFGRVIIEAMACQVPVVGSNSGEIPGTIGDAGVVVPEGDAAALAAALDDLLSNEEKRLALGRRARQRVLDHFTQRAIAERYYRLYRSLLPVGRDGQVWERVPDTEGIERVPR
ncbi:glycosyltransferase [Sphaerobacter sp.]|uniref:glycosyltransferase n=1 Tax=Sphaerobacter sp. TaxID=2099654 RepID=UPI001D6534F5|nr:glycosyltransferase [Sphaerobacter sp.]MBX5444724.1 glycosyltransferase [Sphaerobacter sp.]